MPVSAVPEPVSHPSARLPTDLADGPQEYCPALVMVPILNKGLEGTLDNGNLSLAGHDESVLGEVCLSEKCDVCEDWLGLLIVKFRGWYVR